MSRRKSEQKKKGQRVVAPPPIEKEGDENGICGPEDTRDGKNVGDKKEDGRGSAAGNG